MNCELEEAERSILSNSSHENVIYLILWPSGCHIKIIGLRSNDEFSFIITILNFK